VAVLYLCCLVGVLGTLDVYRTKNKCEASPRLPGRECLKTTTESPDKNSTLPTSGASSTSCTRKSAYSSHNAGM
jgi:hypothetical protein